MRSPAQFSEHGGHLLAVASDGDVERPAARLRAAASVGDEAARPSADRFMPEIEWQLANSTQLAALHMLQQGLYRECTACARIAGGVVTCFHGPRFTACRFPQLKPPMFNSNFHRTGEFLDFNVTELYTHLLRKMRNPQPRVKSSSQH